MNDASRSVIDDSRVMLIVASLSIITYAHQIVTTGNGLTVNSECVQHSLQFVWLNVVLLSVIILKMFEKIFLIPPSPATASRWTSFCQEPSKLRGSTDLGLPMKTSCGKMRSHFSDFWPSIWKHPLRGKRYGSIYNIHI